MFTLVYQGNELGYAYKAKTNEYLLFNMENARHLILNGDNAFKFCEFVELEKTRRDKTFPQRLERIISLFMFFLLPLRDNKPNSLPVLLD